MFETERWIECGTSTSGTRLRMSGIETGAEMAAKRDDREERKKEKGGKEQKKKNVKKRRRKEEEGRRRIEQKKVRCNHCSMNVQKKV